MSEEFEYICKCGYKTPIATAMMIHLSFYKGKKHRFLQAKILKLITKGVNR